MSKVHGYVAICENSPDDRGLLYFTLEAAKEHQKSWPIHVEKYWGVPNHFKGWKEKPKEIKIYSLIIKEEIV